MVANKSLGSLAVYPEILRLFAYNQPTYIILKIRKI